MPYCQITPNLSLFYITNTRNNDVSRFDFSKPTILLLHPVSLDVTWLKYQFEVIAKSFPIRVYCVELN